jgi:hypothetical protein
LGFGACWVRREMERRERYGKEDTQAEEERAVNQSKKNECPRIRLSPSPEKQ